MKHLFIFYFDGGVVMIEYYYLDTEIIIYIWYQPTHHVDWSEIIFEK